MLAHRTRWLVALALSGAVACSFGVDLDGLVDGPSSTPTNDGAVPPDVQTNAPDAIAEVPEAGTFTGLPEAGPPPTNADILALGAGGNFNCLRRSDGTVNCWGRGVEGELATGNFYSSSQPVSAINLGNAIDLSVGGSHACAVIDGGTVQCWGRNDSRQLGNGSTTYSNVPLPVVGLTQAAKHVASGNNFTCAQLADDTAVCWGDNSQGQLGDGTMTARSTAVAVVGVSGITQLVVSSQTACALVSDGSVWCWGDNANGQLANGNQPNDNGTPAPIAAAKLTNATLLAGGSTAGHLCAVLKSGSVQCWGAGSAGQLGGSGSSDSATPVTVPTLTDVTSVALGNNFTCALRKDATSSCWGSNASSTLALSDAVATPSSTTPLATTGLAGVTALAAGLSHACALKDPQNVLCWGSDQYGALGRKRPLIAATPVEVANTAGVTELGVGREFACTTHGDGGTLSCWGNNSYRQQARSDFAIVGVPTPVPGVGGVAQLSTGEQHTCIVESDAGTECWGEDDHGEVGNGTFTYAQTTPVAFAAPAGSDVGAGQYFSCSLTTSTQVWCAGYDSDGRLGRSGTGSLPTPGQVLTTNADGGAVVFSGINVLDVGREGACVAYDGHARVACWGNNSDGQLGTSSGNRAYPQDVNVGGRSVVLARMGYRHTCGVFAQDQVLCWGRNANGQLTGADTSGGFSPRVVSLAVGDAGAKDVALGDDHTCALMLDGTVQCWGAGTQGQLGNGVLADAVSPTPVPGITGATAIRAQENHTCVITPAGVLCWGTDYAGQLGVSPVMQTGTPSAVLGL